MTKDEALRLALEALEKLWGSIDDIDTYGDMAKADEKLYRKLVERRQRQRFEETGISTDGYELHGGAITAIKAALANEALERKAENARELGLDYEPYGFEASIYSNARMKVDVVTGNVSIGTVKKPCGLECDCTDVCKQEAKDEPDYKALWQQMCERCDELDKKLAQRKPLTDEEIQQMFIANSVVVDNGNAYMVAGLRTVNIARAIEAAHGIKEEA